MMYHIWLTNSRQHNPLGVSDQATILYQPVNRGVPGRPNCWAMATPARNSRVEQLRICEPLSEMANSSGELDVLDHRAAVDTQQRTP